MLCAYQILNQKQSLLRKFKWEIFWMLVLTHQLNLLIQEESDSVPSNSQIV